MLKVPGLYDVHRMATLLLAERAPDRAEMLVVGAGGGLELVAMAQARPGWKFFGVDPSAPMLDLARQATVAVSGRVHLVVGTVDQAPKRLFDGATCLLVLHFLDRGERLRTLERILCRLKPGARLVVAHHAPPGERREGWMARSVVFGDRAANDVERAEATGKFMSARMPLMTPNEEEGLLRLAGFVDVELFYAALSFRGWIATAPGN
ncbi:methyltransferase [Pseudorhodoferax aquiterrae]|uniref:Methyltransferase n=1 Tax=Pseudorhodoferax aquiterrae TaxID=747304 RepID=A0ABQ3G6A5_9BURK|nr:methyltransferase [Pseudorhodoferax aquiterrae]